MDAGLLLVHGTAVALGRSAVLIRGAPGSGKSDLALRFLMQPVDGERPPRRLVADDQVHLRRIGARIVATPPPAIRGLFEVRGIGIVAMACIDQADLRLVVDCTARESVDRLPEPATTSLLGLAVRHARIAPFDSSAALKLLMLLENHISDPTARGDPA